MRPRRKATPGRARDAYLLSGDAVEWGSVWLTSSLTSSIIKLCDVFSLASRRLPNLHRGGGLLLLQLVAEAVGLAQAQKSATMPP